MKTIYYISANKYKRTEVLEVLSRLLPADRLRAEAVELKIHEIQHQDMAAIARDKVIKAYKMIGRHCFVEQTGLQIKSFGNLPGGLTQLFWDSLRAEKFADFFVSHNATAVLAKTVLAYCDGRRVLCFEGETEGIIVRPSVEERFQWDCVFRPSGSECVFAEMTLEEKNMYSMRKKALMKFAAYLEEAYDR